MHLRRSFRALPEATDIVPRERMGEGLGFFGITAPISTALAPVIALWLIHHYSFKELFIACFILSLGTLIRVLFLRYPKNENQASGLRPLSGLFVDRVGQKGFDICVVIGFVAVIAAIFILVYISTPLHLIIAGLLYGLCFGYFHSTMLILSVRCVPADKKGTANASYWTALDMGIAVGSLYKFERKLIIVRLLV